MKKTLLALALVATASSTFAAVDLKTEQDKLSYAIGSDLGKNFKQQNIPVEPSIFVQGMKDSMQGKSSQMTDEEMKQTLQNFQVPRIFEEQLDKNDTQITYLIKKLKMLNNMPKPLYIGKDLIKMGYKPSEKFKTILDTLYKMQLNGEIC